MTCIPDNEDRSNEVLTLRLKIKRLMASLREPDKKRLVSNFFSLTVLQASQYLLPLITLPYLVRVLGPDRYGLIAFALSFVGYFQIITDYGFNFSATREISIKRDDRDAVSRIFSTVLVVKLGLLFLCALFCCIIVVSFDRFHGNQAVFGYTFLLLIGQILFPMWLFQGLEQMRFITLLNIFSKLLFTCTVFMFVQTREDYLWVPLLNSLGFIIAGVVALWIAFSRLGVRFICPTIQDVKRQLIEGWAVFISMVSISSYTIANPFILGLFVNDQVVGYYAAADKLVRAAMGFITPLSQALYPFIAKLHSQSLEQAVRLIHKILWLTGAFGFLVSLSLFGFASILVHWVLGHQYAEAVDLIRWMAPLPFIVLLSNIFGTQTLLTFDYKEVYSRILVIFSGLSLLLSVILVPLYFYRATIGINLVVESGISAAMFFALRKQGIDLVRGRMRNTSMHQ